MPVGAKSFVFGLEKEKVHRVEVQTGRRKPGYVEILGGLKEGQVIITDGLVGLQDGNAVKVVGEFAAPADAYDPEVNP